MLYPMLRGDLRISKREGGVLWSRSSHGSCSSSTSCSTDRWPLPRPLAPVVSVLPRALHALSEFFRLEAAGGILLIAAAALAMLCANSPLAGAYEAFRELPVQVSVGDFAIAKPLLLWINDGLMAVFFLLVALEIKREALSGQLSSRDADDPADGLRGRRRGGAGAAVLRRSTTAMPRRCAAGRSRPRPTSPSRWACSALLGSRVPLGMKLLLSTIAVVDDLIAILIIAMFYTARLSVTALAWRAVLRSR